MIHFFNQNRVDYALIGGFAMSAYGLARQTDDIDFIIRNRDSDRTVAFLESLGFRTLNLTEAFSNHEHPLSGFSRIDFLYVNGMTADKIFREANAFPVLGNKRVWVVKPEHLIALKLFSMAANPEREALDRQDLVHLLRQRNLDREEVREYLEKYAMADLIPSMEGNHGP